MPALTKRQIVKVCRDAGYEVLSLTQGKHFRLVVSKDGKTATVSLSITPRSDFWYTWVLADIKRAMQQED